MSVLVTTEFSTTTGRNRMLQCGVITGVLVVLLGIVIWWSLAMRNGEPVTHTLCVACVLCTPKF